MTGSASKLRPMGSVGLTVVLFGCVLWIAGCMKACIGTETETDVEPMEIRQ